MTHGYYMVHEIYDFLYVVLVCFIECKVTSPLRYSFENYSPSLFVIRSIPLTPTTFSFYNKIHCTGPF